METRTQSGVTSREGQHNSPKLLESMFHALYVRHYSNRTTDTYCAKGDGGKTEINAFLTNLAVAKKVSSTTYYHDLYACFESRSIWCTQPG